MAAPFMKPALKNMPFYNIPGRLFVYMYKNQEWLTLLTVRIRNKFTGTYDKRTEKKEWLLTDYMTQKTSR